MGVKQVSRKIQSHSTNNLNFKETSPEFIAGERKNKE
jgi:hypothetical protein